MLWGYAAAGGMGYCLTVSEETEVEKWLGTTIR